jgi:hypothetical protein
MRDIGSHLATYRDRSRLYGRVAQRDRTSLLRVNVGLGDVRSLASLVFEAHAQRFSLYPVSLQR